MFATRSRGYAPQRLTAVCLRRISFEFRSARSAKVRTTNAA
jgi:hypothetical protein